jgi:hypothetical protein
MTPCPENNTLIPGAIGNIEIAFDRPKEDIYPNKLLKLSATHTQNF